MRPNSPCFGTSYAWILTLASDKTERLAGQTVRKMTGRLRGVSQLNDEGIHHACLHLREDYAAGEPRPDRADRGQEARRHRPDPGPLCRGPRQAQRREGRPLPRQAQEESLAL